MNKPFAQFNIPTIQGFIAILLWSMTVALARSISETLGPLTAASAVYFISGMLGVPSMLRPERRAQVFKKEARPYLFICGALFVAYMFFFFMAIGGATSRIQVVEAGLLNYLWPVLTLLGSVMILGKKAKWTLIPSTILAMAGIVLVFVPDIHHLSGFNFSAAPEIYIFGILAAFSWALYSVLARLLGGGLEKGSVTIFLLATALVLSICAFFSNETGTWTLSVFIETLVLSTATFIAYEFWDKAMRKGSVTTVAAFSYLTPLFSTVFSSLYLAVVPTATLWTGCIILIIGSFLSWRSVSG